MNPLIQLKKATPPFLGVFVLVCLTLSPRVQAVFPPPDGGYPGFNTAEGTNALKNLTTGVGNTATGWHSLFANTAGNLNTGVGAGTLLFNAGDNNTATGALALLNNTGGFYNTADGAFALFSNTEGNFNTANGQGALNSNTTGSNNTAIGLQALFSNTTGGVNIALGNNAGVGLTTGNNNIDIGNNGVAGESGTIRIGTAGIQTATFIAGIRGVTTGINDAVNVVIDSDGQLGTTSSSRRFKHDIKRMDNASDGILALKPVTFHYKSDKANRSEFGLIAEDVAEVNPDLVLRDADGQPFTVRYDAVNAMLLNEFLKEHKKVEKQEATITRLTNDFQATVAQQRKEIQALAATVKEQAAQIQKVSAQIEMSKFAPQVVLNNQ